VYHVVHFWKAPPFREGLITYLGSRTTDLGCFGKGSERVRLAECMSQKKSASECLAEARVACVLEE